jgi:hypothetical protein
VNFLFMVFLVHSSTHLWTVFQCVLSTVIRKKYFPEYFFYLKKFLKIKLISLSAYRFLGCPLSGQGLPRCFWLPSAQRLLGRWRSGQVGFVLSAHLRQHLHVIELYWDDDIYKLQWTLSKL